MAVSLFAPVLLAGAAAAVLFAPTAGADAPLDCAGPRGCSGPVQVRDVDPDPDSDQNGYSPDLPAGWLNEAQFAKPGTNPFGAGPMPNILALD